MLQGGALERFRRTLLRLGHMSGRARQSYLRHKGRLLKKRASTILGGSATRSDAPELEDVMDLSEYPPEYISTARTHFEALRHYVPAPYAGRTILFRQARPAGDRSDRTYGWGKLVGANLTVHEVAGSHSSVLEEPGVHVLARALRVALDEALASQGAV